MIAQQATENDPSWVVESGIIAAGVGLLGIALTAWFNALASRRKERRERYAAAAATLAAWIEVPFIIRRRTSNDVETLTRIVEHVQRLQHQLNVDHADFRSDCDWLADQRAYAQGIIQRECSSYINEAWNSPPIKTTSDLVLGDWGPQDQRRHVEAFVSQLKWRFGFRWFLNPFRPTRKAVPHVGRGEAADPSTTPPLVA